MNIIVYKSTKIYKYKIIYCCLLNLKTCFRCWQWKRKLQYFNVNCNITTHVKFFLSHYISWNNSPITSLKAICPYFWSWNFRPDTLLKKWNLWHLVAISVQWFPGLLTWPAFCTLVCADSTHSACVLRIPTKALPQITQSHDAFMSDCTQSDKDFCHGRHLWLVHTKSLLI